MNTASPVLPQLCADRWRRFDGSIGKQRRTLQQDRTYQIAARMIFLSHERMFARLQIKDIAIPALRIGSEHRRAEVERVDERA